MIFAFFFHKSGLQQCLVIILYPVSRTQVCALLIDMHLRLLRLKRARSMHPLNLKTWQRRQVWHIFLFTVRPAKIESKYCPWPQPHATHFKVMPLFRTRRLVLHGCAKKRYSRHLQRSFHNSELSVPSLQDVFWQAKRTLRYSLNK